MRSFAPRAAPWLAVATLTAAGAAAAAGYALTAPKHYRATAQLLVSPVPATDSAFTGIDVLRDSGGKRTAAASAAALVRGPLVADAVRALLGLRRSRDSLLAALDAHVVDSSDVVAVTVEDTSAAGAAQLANAFADTLVNQRTASFQSEVAAASRRYSQLLAAMTKTERSGPAGAELERRLAVLRSVQGRDDPTLKQAGQATPPTVASWPEVPKLTGLGAGIGAAAGLLLALAMLAFGRAGGRGAAQYDHAVPEQDLEQLVDRLDARVAARESALAARERDLKAALAELRAAQAGASADDADLVRRERELEDRVAAVTKREVELARRAAELALRERAVEAADQPEPSAPVSEPDRADPVPAGGGAYNLHDLERLAEERRRDFPERVEEWSAYLFFLREYAGPDGSVPESFDRLIEEAFGELVS